MRLIWILEFIRAQKLPCIWPKNWFDSALYSTNSGRGNSPGQRFHAALWIVELLKLRKTKRRERDGRGWRKESVHRGKKYHARAESGSRVNRAVAILTMLLLTVHTHTYTYTHTYIQGNLCLNYTPGMHRTPGLLVALMHREGETDSLPKVFYETARPGYKWIRRENFIRKFATARLRFNRVVFASEILTRSLDGADNCPARRLIRFRRRKRTMNYTDRV